MPQLALAVPALLRNPSMRPGLLRCGSRVLHLAYRPRSVLIHPLTSPKTPSTVCAFLADPDSIPACEALLQTTKSDISP